MTASPTELERKVRRLDNDVTSIYQMLSLIQLTQSRHTTRLDELDSLTAGVDTRLTRVEGKVDAIDAKLSGHDDRFTGIDDKLFGIEQSLGTVLELLQRG